MNVRTYVCRGMGSGTAGSDFPSVHCIRIQLHGAVRRLPDPPRDPLGPRRKDRSPKSGTAVRPYHHLVHEGGWTLSMTPDRIATWTRPGGTTFHTGPTTDRAANGVGRPPSTDELQ